MAGTTLCDAPGILAALALFVFRMHVPGRQAGAPAGLEVVMALRPLIGLAQLLLLLLLLAGAPVAAGGQPSANGLTRLQDSSVATLAPDDRGGLPGLAAVAAWIDIDDEPDLLALVPMVARPDPALVFVAFARFAYGRPAPLSHWPCASPPTGPPTL
jgi:hypothetical protein